MNRLTIARPTRQIIRDELVAKRIHWSGRMTDIEFLNRVWNLDTLPSTDSRLQNAEADIWQHRVNNFDWDDDWFYHDPRFDLLTCPDATFLDFLCQTVHPVVREPDEADRLVRFFNACLIKDGVELAVASRRPRLDGDALAVYEARSRQSRLKPLEPQRFAHLTDPQVLSVHLRRIEEGVVSDPELAIGSAKELVESLCKQILDRYGEAYVTSDDLLDLYKKVSVALRLNAESVPASRRGSEAAQRALRSLVATIQSLAELRNELGLGHGRPTLGVALARHARLASTASRAVTEFLLETWQARRNATGDAYPSSQRPDGG